MARTDWIRPEGLIYLDANVIVYFIERQDALQEKVAEVLRAGVAAGCRFIVSEAGVAECFYGVFRSGSRELGKTYDAFFRETALIELTPVDGSLLMRAAQCGASAGLRLLDAVHVVSAIEAGATHLLTNDQAISRAQGIEIVQLADL